MLRSVFYAVPAQWRYLLRRAYYLPVDMYEGLTGKRSAMIPPKGAIFTGSGDFIRQGENFLNHFINLGGLQPQHRILDVGCGMGRMAIPLTGFLNESGSYEGFDIIDKGIQWCKKHIATRYPNFNFTLVRLNNRLYNNDGDAAATFRFPYPDESFDFVLLTSVFTHMLPEDVKRYMHEIRRVLKKDGRCFATFFILDQDAIQFMQRQDAPFFPHPKGDYYLHNLQVPEANIGFIPAFIDRTCQSSGLKLDHFYPGWWSGRPRANASDFQDILIFTRIKE